MWRSSGLRVPPSEIPVDPTAPEARQWAEEELAKAAYNPTDTIFTRIGRWIGNLFQELLSGQFGASNPILAVVIAIALLAVVALVIVFASRVRRVRNVTASRSHSLFDDARTSEELSRDARSALQRGEYSAAFLDSYRAIIRSLDERVLIEDRPGLTAREAAALASIPFPRFEHTWNWASATFDAVCYGTATPTGDEARHLLEFGSTVARTTPARSAVVGA